MKGNTGLCHRELSVRELYAGKFVFCFYVREKSRLTLHQLHDFEREGKSKLFIMDEVSVLKILT